jgi:hypothetical protein
MEMMRMSVTLYLEETQQISYGKRTNVMKNKGQAGIKI